jgi:hypothetical protein
MPACQVLGSEFKPQQRKHKNMHKKLKERNSILCALRILQGEKVLNKRGRFTFSFKGFF